MSERDERIAAIEADVNQAEKTIERLCNGEERWRMSIPARPDSDPDLVLSRAIAHAQWLLVELRSTRRALAESETKRNALAERVITATCLIRHSLGDKTVPFPSDDDVARLFGVPVAARADAPAGSTRVYGNHLPDDAPDALRVTADQIMAAAVPSRETSEPADVLADTLQLNADGSVQVRSVPGTLPKATDVPSPFDDPSEPDVANPDWRFTLMGMHPPKDEPREPAGPETQT